MGEPSKSTSTRKPPEPSESHAAIDDWMKRVMPDLQPIVEAIDGTIRETIPDLRYAIKWRKAYYGTPDLGWIVELVAYDVSVNAVFLGGVAFDRPPPLGDRGDGRYVKIASLDEAQAPEMRDWIEQAGNVPGWR